MRIRNIIINLLLYSILILGIPEILINLLFLLFFFVLTVIGRELTMSLSWYFLPLNLTSGVLVLYLLNKIRDLKVGFLTTFIFLFLGNIVMNQDLFWLLSAYKVFIFFALFSIIYSLGFILTKNALIKNPKNLFQMMIVVFVWTLLTIILISNVALFGTHGSLMFRLYIFIGEFLRDKLDFNLFWFDFGRWALIFFSFALSLGLILISFIFKNPKKLE